MADHDYYGMAIFKIEGKEYAVGTVEQTEIAARGVARECLNLIDTDLLLQHAGLPLHAKEMVKFMQEDCWEAFDVLLKVIPDLDGLVETAIAKQGKTIFLSLYADGVEYSLTDFSQHRDLILQGLGLSPVQGDGVRLYLLQDVVVSDDPQAY